MNPGNPHTGRDTLVDAVSESGKSALSKYRDMFVGSRSLWTLLKYETLTLCVGSMPGAAGFVLRKMFFPSLLSSVGRGTIIGPRVTLRCPGRIRLGEHVLVDSDTVLDAKGEESRITLGDRVLVGKNTILSCASAVMELGNDVSIGPHCYLRAGLCPLTIGSEVTIASHVAVIAGNLSYRRLDMPIKRQTGTLNGVSIGDDVWIGTGVRIVDGVRIGSGAVLGAGAVVTRDIPDYSIAVGVPAKVRGDRRSLDSTASG